MPVAVVAEDKAAYVTGILGPSTGATIFTARVVSTGVGWTHTYAGLGNVSDRGNYPVGIALTSSSEVMVGGSSEGSGYSDTHLTVLKLNSRTGDMIWDRRYRGSEYSEGNVRGFAFYNDTVYLSGSMRLNGHGYEIAAAGYDSTGALALGYVRPSTLIGQEGSSAIAANAAGVYLYGNLQTFTSGGNAIDDFVVMDAASGGVVLHFGQVTSDASMAADANGFALGRQDPTTNSAVFTRYSNAWSLLGTANGGTGSLLGGVAMNGGFAYGSGATSANFGADYFLTKY